MKIDTSKAFFILTTNKKQEVIDKLTKFGYDPIWFNPDKYLKYLIDNQDDSLNVSELKDFNKQKYLEELDYSIIAAYPRKIIRTCNPKFIFSEDSPFKEYPKITEAEFLEKFAKSISLSAKEVREIAWRNVPESTNVLISKAIEDIYEQIVDEHNKFKSVFSIAKYYMELEKYGEIPYKSYYFRLFSSKIINEFKSNGFDVEVLVGSESLAISWL